MKQKFAQFYMDVAHRTAQLSYAQRLKVGCIIVKQDRIVSLGFNGTPSGWDNTCETQELMPGDVGGWLSPEEIEQTWPHTNSNDERYKLVTKPEVLHSEMNALMKLAKSTDSGAGAIMFITHAPCINCAKAIYQAGISEVVYGVDYRSTDGTYFLQKCGMKISKMVPSDTEDAHLAQQKSD